MGIWGYWYFFQKPWFQLVLHPVQHFLMMYSAYKLNKQGDNIQAWRTPFPIWHQSVVPCPIQTVASWPAYRFSGGRWDGLLVPYNLEFSTVCCEPYSQSLAFSMEQKKIFFWNSRAFSMIQQMLAIWYLVSLPFLNPAWTSGSSWFMYCWSLAWRILIISFLECETSPIGVVVWTFFGIVFLWDWNESWLFQVLWSLLSFPNLLAYWAQHFHSTIF